MFVNKLLCLIILARITINISYTTESNSTRYCTDNNTVTTLPTDQDMHYTCQDDKTILLQYSKFLQLKFLL